MDRIEFIQILRNQLSGQMQEDRVAAHIRYYEDYIQSKVRSGRSEKDVLAELGDPRLIAKTLIDTNTEGRTEVYEDYQDAGYRGYSDEQERKQERNKKHHLDLSTWYGKAIVILGAILSVVLLVAIIGTVIPFLIVFVLILYLISWWKKRK